jgi:hypothetical protein
MDAERLRHDPAMCWIVGGKAAQRSAASPSQMRALIDVVFIPSFGFVAASMEAHGWDVCVRRGKT